MDIYDGIYVRFDLCLAKGVHLKEHDRWMMTQGHRYLWSLRHLTDFGLNWVSLPTWREARHHQKLRPTISVVRPSKPRLTHTYVPLTLGSLWECIPIHCGNSIINAFMAAIDAFVHCLGEEVKGGWTSVCVLVWHPLFAKAIVMKKAWPCIHKHGVGHVQSSPWTLHVGPIVCEN